MCFQKILQGLCLFCVISSLAIFSANAENKADISKSGLLGIFAKGKTQDQLQAALDGSGVVGSAAKRAKGSGGSSNESNLARSGGLAAVGRGGRGERTYGISGVQTKGSGTSMKGSGAGLSGKANMRVVPSGNGEPLAKKKDRSGTGIKGSGADGKTNVKKGESFVGVMDKNAIRRVVQRNINQLKFCYEKLGERDPNASGRVELGWDIKSGGRVGSVSVVRSQIKDEKMLNCMKRRLAAWRFPDPPEGVIGEITYPFVFAVSGGESFQNQGKRRQVVQRTVVPKKLRVHNQNGKYQFAITCFGNDCGENIKCIFYFNSPRRCRVYDENQNIAMNLQCDAFGDCKPS